MTLCMSLCVCSFSEEKQEDKVVTVPIIVHVIAKDDGSGNVDDVSINRQLEVLNEGVWYRDTLHILSMTPYSGG